MSGFTKTWRAPGIGAYFGAECEKRGMLVRVSGENIMMSPPFIISPEEVDEVGDPFLSLQSGMGKFLHYDRPVALVNYRGVQCDNDY